MRQAFSGLLIVCALGVVSSHAQRPASRILKLEELRFPQIDALDRERTMFILPIGMLEGHGPHLPIASDTLGVMFEANAVATRVSRQLPQWNVVMMPPLHYGETGANEIGGIDEYHGIHATVLTSDLDFSFARRLFEHFGKALPRGRVRIQLHRSSSTSERPSFFESRRMGPSSVSNGNPDERAASRMYASYAYIPNSRPRSERTTIAILVDDITDSHLALSQRTLRRASRIRSVQCRQNLHIS
jgi:Creatinine amidohydrolase